MPDITDYEAQQIDQANASKITPVVFIHGLCSCRPAGIAGGRLFEEAGYVPSRRAGR